MPDSSIKKPLAKLNTAVAGLGILLVVLGHSMVTNDAERDRSLAGNPLYEFLRMGVFPWIYTFHMPLFFFLAGWNYQQFTRPKGRSFLHTLHDKALRLLVPYVVISCIAFPMKVLLSQFAQRPVRFSVSSFLGQILIPWDNTIIYFWFLPTLFLMFVALPLFNFWNRSWFWKLIGLVVCLACYLNFPHQPRGDQVLKWFNIAGVLHNSLFFFGGMALQRDLSAFPRDASLPLAIACFAGSLLMFSQHTEEAGLINLLLAMFGIAGCWFLCLAVAETDVFLTRIGKDSFQIYLFSWFPQIAIRILLFQILHLPINPIVAISFLAGVTLPMLVTAVLDRIMPRQLAFLYGR